MSHRRFLTKFDPKNICSIADLWPNFTQKTFIPSLILTKFDPKKIYPKKVGHFFNVLRNVYNYTKLFIMIIMIKVNMIALYRSTACWPIVLFETGICTLEIQHQRYHPVFQNSDFVFQKSAFKEGLSYRVDRVCTFYKKCIIFTMKMIA